MKKRYSKEIRIHNAPKGGKGRNKKRSGSSDNIRKRQKAQNRKRRYSSPDAKRKGRKRFNRDFKDGKKKQFKRKKGMETKEDLDEQLDKYWLKGKKYDKVEKELDRDLEEYMNTKRKLQGEESITDQHTEAQGADLQSLNQNIDQNVNYNQMQPGQDLQNLNNQISMSNVQDLNQEQTLNTGQALDSQLQGGNTTQFQYTSTGQPEGGVQYDPNYAAPTQDANNPGQGYMYQQ